MNPTRDDLALYVIGAYDGDTGALEAHLAEDAAAREIVAEEAGLELLLRDAAAAARFCAGCDDLVAGERCDACGTAVAPGGYTVERVLVSNAHGRMYVAHDIDGKQVALKELAFVQAPGVEVVAAFEREAKFLRALEHAGIPRFCAAFEEGTGVHTRYYLAQELVSGQALDERLADHWYTEAEIVDIARQVLTILVYLQGVSPMVIHRDIKPANLIRRAEGGAIALVDFGAAHVQGTTVGSTTIGTFGYMPVEQLAGQVDATTDGYALGASLLHLLTRSEPWRLLQGAMLGPVNVSAPVRRFLQKLTAPEPRDRYSNAAAALAALERIERGEEPMEPAIVTKQPRWYARRPLAAIALAAMVSAGAGAAVVTIVRDASMEHDDRLPEEAIAPRLAPSGPVRSKVEQPRIPAGKPIDMQFKASPLPDVVRFLGETCGLNVIFPDYIDGPVTVDLAQVPCDQAFEVLLESRGLWYRYDPDAKLVRIMPRKQLDAEAEAAAMLAPLGPVGDPLPPGPAVNVDFKWAPLRDLLTLLAKPANVSIVLPDEIEGKVTVRLADVPWDRAFAEILAAHGLGYRYREKGRVVRIAPQKELDAERERELELLPRRVPGTPAP